MRWTEEKLTWLKEQDGRPIQEVADELGISANAVHVARRKAGFQKPRRDDIHTEHIRAWIRARPNIKLKELARELEVSISTAYRLKWEALDEFSA